MVGDVGFDQEALVEWVATMIANEIMKETLHDDTTETESQRQ